MTDKMRLGRVWRQALAAAHSASLIQAGSGPESSYRNDCNLILTHVAQSGADYDGKQRGFTRLRGIDPLVSEPAEILSRFVHLTLAQLDLECSPPTISCPHHGIDFESRAILVLQDLCVCGLSSSWLS